MSESRGEGGPTRRSYGPPLEEADLRARIAGQVQVVREQLGEEDVGWDSDDPADFSYLYREGKLLVRDRDLDRVRSVVDGEVVDSLVNGVSLFDPRGRGTEDALQAIDAALGAGVATPDHVVYVTPTGGCCPASEPEEPGDSPPWPTLPPAPEGSGRDILVAVVDTGWLPEAAVSTASPWLHGVTGDVEAYDPSSIHHYVGHGTFVAGVVRSLAPSARVRVEGFLTNGGAVFESELIKQLNDSLVDAPDIITMSAGTSTRNHYDLLAFQVFWETRLSRLKGTVLLCAAGNDGGRGPFWPAAFPWTISVGALDQEGLRADFSNFGSWVDVYAPGVDLVNAYATGTYVAQEPPHAGERRTFAGRARWSGTSFSTPVVAGLIAARMNSTGETAREAADSLLVLARAHADPRVGARLTPDAVAGELGRSAAGIAGSGRR